MPVILVLYGHSLGIALHSLSGGYRAGMALAWFLEACYLAIIVFVIALPASGSARWYRWVAPAVAALFTLGLAVDSRLYEALAFHLNGLIIRVAFQPGALAQIGIPTREFTRFAALALGLAGLDILAGAWFIRRFQGHRFRWWYVALMILLPVSERLFTATLQFTGGRVVLADSDVLPLQIPFRMYQFLSKITGKPYGGEEVLAVNASRSAAPVLPPDSIRFNRRPDILLILIESLRSDFLNDSTMPKLWSRAASGARMTHHYASASSTHYALFSVVFGLNASRLEQVVGTGTAPLLFSALKDHGYRMRLITASSVDWMGMKQTVFKDVADKL
ncbi:MAG TPA: sulfatase-like hydrolase/transferase, partial [Gemmatimonadales bacterium]